MSIPQMPKYFLYGDCAESLPLAVMTNHLDLTGTVSILSFAASTKELQVMGSIPEGEPFMFPIKLKNPCLNCESLMRKLPEAINILAASGLSQRVYWKVRNSITRVDFLCSPPETVHIPLRKGEFSFSAAYNATKYQIFEILEDRTLLNANPYIASADLSGDLIDLWYEFIVPYRDNETIFRLSPDGNVQPLMLTINGVTIPICTIFCAMGYILSTVLWPDRVVAERSSYYLPLMAILAKWCYTLCPWGYPSVINAVSATRLIPGNNTLVFLGTSKPKVQDGGNTTSIQPEHTRKMRGFRKTLLENRIGSLEDPCPEKLAADIRYLSQLESNYGLNLDVF